MNDKNDKWNNIIETLCTILQMVFLIVFALYFIHLYLTNSFGIDDIKILTIANLFMLIDTVLTDK
jgi:hypothetical protein